ncbi:VOC family protein [Spirillospora sp. NPDC047279]|uniref:VOC family protein n=1 Tax=Spirillospora sp. NPDC047279 TaxID=3155478 RepID=UPI00340E79E2
MPEVNGHAPGWPSFAELATPDVKASVGFYRSLFGWYAYTIAVADLGDYEVFSIGDVQGPEVAGMQTLADDAQRPSWACYFRTDDVQGTVDLIKAEGGHELVPPLDVSDLGQMALCADSQGGEFALWRPGNMTGAGVVDEPWAMCWVELACRDVEEARRFYGRVFGWKPLDRDYHDSVYTDFTLGDWPVAGMVQMDERWPASYPAHWIPYFWVEDCDVSAGRAVELGGKIRIPPTDIQPGRYAMLTDPTGARLGIITPTPGLRPPRPGV